MFTIIGLENQSGRGKFARHAVGGRFVDYLKKTDEYGPWASTNGLLHCSDPDKNIRLVKIGEGKLHLAGEILAEILLEHNDAAKAIVCYDEANLELGEAVFSPYPWTQTQHMGLKNIEERLGMRYAHCAIGIGALPSREEYEEFFNVSLTADQVDMVLRSFSELKLSVLNHIREYRQEQHDFLISIPEETAILSQSSDREVNLRLSPFCISLSKSHVEHLDRAVDVLVRIIQRTANSYARLLHDEDEPGRYELVRLLEYGVPGNMRDLVRLNGHHIEHMSFDFHSGMLLEINPAPLPPFVSSRTAELLDIKTPGVSLTPELLCERPIKIASRFGESILLLNRIGGLKIGQTGWFGEVASCLRSQGIKVVTGSNEDGKTPMTIWANLTWMTPDRIPSVVSSEVIGNVSRIFPSPRNFLFTSKWFLALLNDGYAQEIMGINEKEQKVISEVVPWTGELKESVGIVSFALRNGLSLYGKPFLSSGGRGGGKIRKMKDLKQVGQPGVVQEWVEPYKLLNTGYNHDVRIVVYGSRAQKRVWQSRVWMGSSVLQHPMDAPVVIG